MTRSRGGAPDTTAEHVSAVNGSGISQSPDISLEQSAYQIVEVRQTTLAEFDDWFAAKIKSMDDAVECWREVAQLEGLLQVQKGRYLRNVERYIDGGLLAFLKRVDLASSTAYYFIDVANLADDDRVSKRLETLGPSKVALIEKAPAPDVMWDWYDSQSKVPTASEIRQKVREQHYEQRAAQIENTPSPDGNYNVIVVDPPWPFYPWDPLADRRYWQTRMNQRPYPEMDLEQIKALKIPAADDCVLWLWVTNRNILQLGEVIDAWGFEYKTLLTWVKNRIGTGYWLRGQTEHCALCIRGSIPWDVGNTPTILDAPLRADSQKPDEFYQMVDLLCHGRKLDMFSREKREGWDQWGDEVDKF